MSNITMLSTLDNPFNPFKQFDDWLNYDTEKGYNTCGLLARIAKSSDALSDVDEDIAIEEAMQEIIRLNVSGNYILVEEDFIPRVRLTLET